MIRKSVWSRHAAAGRLSFAIRHRGRPFPDSGSQLDGWPDPPDDAGGDAQRPAAARRAKKADAFLGGAASDFEALEKLRQLAFGEKVPRPVQKDLFEAAAPAT